MLETRGEKLNAIKKGIKNNLKRDLAVLSYLFEFSYNVLADGLHDKKSALVLLLFVQMS